MTLADSPEAPTDPLATLDRLARTGLRLADAIVRRAEAAGPEEDLNALAIAHARVARAVRLAILLRARLAEGAKSWLQIEARTRRARQTDRVERIVARVIGDQAEDEAEAKRMMEETGDRLETDDIYGDVLNRPIGELVAEICRDLGLTPDWRALAQEAWAREEMEKGIWSPARPLSLAGEVARRDGGGIEQRCGMPPPSASLTAPPQAGEHGSDSG